MEENTYFQICALQIQHGGQSGRQETESYKLTYTSKFGVFPCVFEVLEFNGIIQNKAM
jgi:hypothetical protein